MINDPKQWRLIPPIKASGQWQMAIDAWLLQQHSLGQHPPTLRFYTWEPVALSLGYFQRRYPAQWHEIRWQGQPLDIVRRPSGGRAVLHQGDLTYAVVTSGLRGDRQQNYSYLCQFLIQGWQKLGVDLFSGQTGRGYRNQANCFATSTPADLVDGEGHKRVGSAQKYQGQAILHHGSMGIGRDRELYQRVFGEECPLDPPLPQADPFTIVINSLQAAAQSWFGVELQAQPLTAPEESAIAALISKI